MRCDDGVSHVTDSDDVSRTPSRVTGKPPGVHTGLGGTPLTIRPGVAHPWLHAVSTQAGHGLARACGRINYQPDVVLMLAERRRRWANIKTISDQRQFPGLPFEYHSCINYYVPC